MFVHIHQGKGNQDRDVMLSPRLLDELREYWRWMNPKPKTYLFRRSGAAAVQAEAGQSSLAELQDIAV